MKSTRTTRPITVSLPPQLTKKADQVMRRTGKTRSELFREALARYFDGLEFEQLARYGESRAAKLQVRQSDVEQLIDEVRQSTAK